ncbi:MarC family protein [Paraburkholderia tropica]|nr:MarC family protein [Paraburkholderia tropica]
MAIDFTFSMKVFSSLFAIMNPIANIPVFLSLTEGMADGKKRAVAATTFIGVTIGCVISVTVGETILNVFGVSIEDFRLAGGLLVLLIALDMVHGSPSAQHTPQRREVGASGYDQDVAIFPLTTPLLVGPGTIATLVRALSVCQGDGNRQTSDGYDTGSNRGRNDGRKLDDNIQGFSSLARSVIDGSLNRYD